MLGCWATCTRLQKQGASQQRQNRQHLPYNRNNLAINRGLLVCVLRYRGGAGDAHNGGVEAQKWRSGGSVDQCSQIRITSMLIRIRRFTFNEIRLQFFTLMRIRIQRFTLMRIRIQLFTLMRIRIQLFTLMRIRIQRFTLVRIRILIEVMRICDHWSTEPQTSILSVLVPPRLHFETHNS